MENNYKYIICDEINGSYIADHKSDHITYKDKQYGSHMGFIREYRGFHTEQSNFLIKCVGTEDDTIFTTSYKKLKCNLSSCSGRDRIKELYNILELKRKGEYGYKEDEDPLVDHTHENNDSDSDNESTDDLEPNDILKSIRFTMEIVSKYTEQLDSTSEIHKYTTIHEQLDAIRKYVKNE